MVFSFSSSTRLFRVVAASTVFTTTTAATATDRPAPVTTSPLNPLYLPGEQQQEQHHAKSSSLPFPSRRSLTKIDGDSPSTSSNNNNSNNNNTQNRDNTASEMSEFDHGFHVWDRPIRTVAVIGSGPSGTPCARQLQAAGLDVKVFERQPQPGGIWNWSPASTAPLSIPTPPPSLAAFVPVARGRQGSRVYSDVGGDDAERFNPANPVYWTLTNNVPTTTMAFKDFPYPPGTNQNISHALISSYVRAYAQHFGIDQITSYNTRVETVDKVQNGSKESWRLRLRKLETLQDGHLRETIWEELFDAVVVATGHYNAPKIPSIPGVSSWSHAFGRRLLHSQGYRTPDQYAGKNVMIVGIGTSGADIARDLSPHVNKLYMVGREIKRDSPKGYQVMRRMQRFTLPSNAEQVREIDHFVQPSEDAGEADISKGRVVLKDGRVLSGIDHVIFATGYQYSYPFLSQLHIDPATKAPSGFSFPIVTDGSSVQHLYRDTFYLPDPTLAFVGLSINTSAFSFFEYQSLAIARVWARQAALPNFARRWNYYEQRVGETGGGVWMHFMGREGERQYVKDTVDWLNRDAQWSGAPPVEGHSEEWLRESDLSLGRIAKKYGLSEEQWKSIANGPEERETAREETARKVRQALLSRAREA